jgi:hypothetical protein
MLKRADYLRRGKGSQEGARAPRIERRTVIAFQGQAGSMHGEQGRERANDFPSNRIVYGQPQQPAASSLVAHGGRANTSEVFGDFGSVPSSVP